MAAFRPKSLVTALLLAYSSTLFANPIVIAHRGASGYLPEHTTQSATLAHQQSADYIEQDVVLSKDGVPVVLHDIHLDTVTDVAVKFPDRAAKDKRYYAADFTLAELKTLRIHERTNAEGKPVFPNRYNGTGEFRIATFAEHISLIAELNRQLQQNAGYYVEVKDPKWHKARGLDPSKAVLQVLREHNLDSETAKVYIQCFDFAELKRIKTELKAKVPLVLLLGQNDWKIADSDYDYLQTDKGLTEVAKVAQGIGPWIPQVIAQKDGEVVDTGLVKRAHEKGLVVHPYTYRIDQLPYELSEYQTLDWLFNKVKVDGIFSDFPDVAKRFFSE